MRLITLAFNYIEVGFWPQIMMQSNEDFFWQPQPEAKECTPFVLHRKRRDFRHMSRLYLKKFIYEIKKSLKCIFLIERWLSLFLNKIIKSSWHTFFSNEMPRSIKGTQSIYLYIYIYFCDLLKCYFSPICLIHMRCWCAAGLTEVWSWLRSSFAVDTLQNAGLQRRLL